MMGAALFFGKNCIQRDIVFTLHWILIPLNCRMRVPSAITFTHGSDQERLPGRAMSTNSKSNGSRTLRVLYNCDKCPSYCCSYVLIGVYAADIRRLARHFGIS